jgi:hypothetical protein
VRAGNDFQVQLHGDPVRFHTELCDQRGNTKVIRKFALFAIDVEEHNKALALGP